MKLGNIPQEWWETNQQVLERKYRMMKKAILKTSQQWLQDEPEFFNLVVHDPDGWDRKNFNYSFYKEKITLEEFRRRLLQSTSIFYKKVKHETFKPVREDAGKSV